MSACPTTLTVSYYYYSIHVCANNNCHAIVMQLTLTEDCVLHNTMINVCSSIVSIINKLINYKPSANVGYCSQNETFLLKNTFKKKCHYYYYYVTRTHTSYIVYYYYYYLLLLCMSYDIYCELFNNDCFIQERLLV
jgi:hypothetical protein